MLDYLKTVRDRMRSNREIDSLDDRVLMELGISRYALRKLSATSQTVMRRFTAMSSRQNVAPTALSSDMQNMSVLVERCRNCGNTRACAEFLDDSSVGSERAAFCPNFAEFRRLSHRA